MVGRGKTLTGGQVFSSGPVLAIETVESPRAKPLGLMVKGAFP